MRRAVVVIGVLALVAALGWAFARTVYTSDATSGRSSSPLDAATAAPPTPSRAPNEPAATADIEAARRAGVAAVSRTGEVVSAGMFSRADVVALFSTPRYAPVLASETSAQVNAFLLALGVSGGDATDVSVAETPVTAATQRTETGVRVQVWSVLLVTTNAGVARQAWRTVTVDLVEVDRRWLVDGWSSSPGPAPAPAVEATFGDANAVRERLAWPTASESGG